MKYKIKGIGCVLVAAMLASCGGDDRSFEEKFVPATISHDNAAEVANNLYQFLYYLGNVYAEVSSSRIYDDPRNFDIDSVETSIADISDDLCSIGNAEETREGIHYKRNNILFAGPDSSYAFEAVDCLFSEGDWYYNGSISLDVSNGLVSTFQAPYLFSYPDPSFSDTNVVYDYDMYGLIDRESYYIRYRDGSLSLDFKSSTEMTFEYDDYSELDIQTYSSALYFEYFLNDFLLSVTNDRRGSYILRSHTPFDIGEVSWGGRFKGEINEEIVIDIDQSRINSGLFTLKSDNRSTLKVEFNDGVISFELDVGNDGIIDLQSTMPSG